MSNEKRVTINEDDLFKVSGGVSRYLEVGKYYCIASSEDISNGFPLHNSLRFGPFDTFEEAKNAGNDWAIESHNKGHVNIYYILGQYTDAGWNKIEEIHYPQ